MYGVSLAEGTDTESQLSQDFREDDTWSGPIRERHTTVAILDYYCLYDPEDWAGTERSGYGNRWFHILPFFFDKGGQGKVLLLPNDRYGHMATLAKRARKSLKGRAGVYFLNTNQCRQNHPLMLATWAAEANPDAWTKTLGPREQANRTNEAAMHECLHQLFPCLMVYNLRAFQGPCAALDYLQGLRTPAPGTEGPAEVDLGAL